MLIVSDCGGSGGGELDAGVEDAAPPPAQDWRINANKTTPEMVSAAAAKRGL
jgi:hypothetical protein